MASSPSFPVPQHQPVRGHVSPFIPISIFSGLSVVALAVFMRPSPTPSVTYAAAPPSYPTPTASAPSAQPVYNAAAPVVVHPRAAATTVASTAAPAQQSAPAVQTSAPMHHAAAGPDGCAEVKEDERLMRLSIQAFPNEDLHSTYMYANRDAAIQRASANGFVCEPTIQ